MKYQITCDNCGTQFIVEAGEGQVVECQCPHCKGVMEITLPIVSGTIPNQTPETNASYAPNYENENAQAKANKTVLYAVIVGLLLVALSAAAYFAWLRPANDTPEPQTTPMDTIPYQVEQEPVVEEPIDTAVVPEIKVEAPKDTVKHKHHEEKQEVDSTAVGE